MTFNTALQATLVLVAYFSFAATAIFTIAS